MPDSNPSSIWDKKDLQFVIVVMSHDLVWSQVRRSAYLSLYNASLDWESESALWAIFSLLTSVGKKKKKEKKNKFLSACNCVSIKHF